MSGQVTHGSAGDYQADERTGVPGLAGDYQANEREGARGSAGDYQADERAGVTWVSWRLLGR